jgi:uncharacterized membrane protein
MGGIEAMFEWFVAFAAGVALAAASGLRAFLPLFALGLGARLGWISLQDGAQWLGSDPALISFGLATVLEIAGDKIPVVDHVLDALGTGVRPLAGAFAAYAVLIHWPTPWAQIAALVLGAGSLLVHVSKAKIRLGSSALTLGAGNPVVSAAEDGIALSMVVVAIVLPIMAAIVVILVTWMILRRRSALSSSEAPVSSAHDRS